MRTTVGYQADRAGPWLRRVSFERRDLRADDIAVRVDYCGVCHTDLHAIRAPADAGASRLIPGHEFTGVVTEIGREVTAFTVGDAVAVGNIVDSCDVCAMCCAVQDRRTSASSSRR